MIPICPFTQTGIDHKINTHMNFYLYTSEGQTDLPAPSLNPNLNDPRLYQPSKGLQDAVNVALALGQPLLVTGEPGTGKTQLAWHVAHRFRLGEPVVFNAQTSSTANDLFYKYDALGHFQYSHNQKEPLSPEEIEARFIHYQALGTAIRSDKRTVVLIDEVDKAPRDLPNDVLSAIERLEFRVPEVGKTFTADHRNRPVIILTSNSEKNLPDAFLRRVVYYHIPFPDAETLLEILSKKVAGYNTTALKTLIAHFEEIRASKQLRKNPATAELIFWATLLHQTGFDPGVLDSGKIQPEDREKLLMSYSVLAKTREDLNTLAKM